jgi:hypothetical protein
LRKRGTVSLADHDIIIFSAALDKDMNSNAALGNEWVADPCFKVLIKSGHLNI